MPVLRRWPHNKLLVILTEGFLNEVRISGGAILPHLSSLGQCKYFSANIIIVNM